MIAVFDYDGTIFDTRSVDPPAVNETRASFSLPPLSVERILSFVGLNTTEFYEACFEKNRTATEKEMFGKLFLEAEQRHIERTAELLPGIGDMLAHLYKDGVKMAVCSNGSRDYVVNSMKKLGIYDLFVHVWTYEEGSSKSEATGVILRKYGGGDGFFVGDRIMDIEAAVENRIPVICTTMGFGGAEAYAANYVVCSADEMESSIRSLYFR